MLILAKKEKIAAPNKIKAAATCTGPATTISFILDHSSSITLPAYGGSQGNIDAIKFAMMASMNALINKNVHTDVISFSTNAQRINTGWWFPLVDQAAANWQTMITNSGYDSTPNGTTNWEAGLRQADNAILGLPKYIIFFTDGNPTENVTAPTNDDGYDAVDLWWGVTKANELRSRGVTIIPIGIGNVDKPKLDALGGGTSLYGSSYGDLLTLLSAAISQTGVVACPDPTSTLGVIATDTVGNQLPNVKFNYSGSPFTGGQFDTGATGGFNYKTATTNSAWGFNTSYASGAPQYYVVDNVYCRQGPWAASSPIISTTGNVAGGTVASGETVRCHYTFKDGRIPRTPNMLVTVNVTSPNPARVYEQTSSTLVSTITITNTGNVPLTNLSAASSPGPTITCIAGSLAPNATGSCTYTHPAYEPELGSIDPRPYNVVVTGTATITPSLEYFVNPPAIWTPIGAASGTLTKTGTTFVNIGRIKLPV